MTPLRNTRRLRAVLRHHSVQSRPRLHGPHQQGTVPVLLHPPPPRYGDERDLTREKDSHSKRVICEEAKDARANLVYRVRKRLFRAQRGTTRSTLHLRELRSAAFVVKHTHIAQATYFYIQVLALALPPAEVVAHLTLTAWP